MPYLIGVCVTGSIAAPLSAGQDPPIVNPTPEVQAVISEPTNQVVPFTQLATFNLPWTAERIARYGSHGSFQVYIKGPDDDVFRLTQVQVSPADSNTPPASYNFDFGATVDGFIVIS